MVAAVIKAAVFVFADSPLVAGSRCAVYSLGSSHTIVKKTPSGISLIYTVFSKFKLPISFFSDVPAILSGS